MTVSFATFDRLKAKGVEAYKNGDGQAPLLTKEGVRGVVEPPCIPPC
jgi:hypothetical protein